MDETIKFYWEDIFEKILSDTCNYNFLELYENAPVEEEYTLTKEVSKNIQKIVGEEVDKQFILITSVLQIALSRYFQRKQIVLYSPSIKSKNHSDISSNLIPLVTSIESDLTLKEVVVENGENIVKAYSFQKYFDKVDQEKPEKFNNYLGVFCPQIHHKEQLENFCRFIIEVHINDETIVIKVLDKERKITDISGGFIQLLVHFLEQLQTPNVKIKSIPWYSEYKIKEISQQCMLLRETKIKDSLIGFFERQVRLTPNAPALTFKELKYSYDELNKEVNKLTNYLSDEYNVGLGKGIILYLDRSIYMYISILAILKSRAYYIPIKVGALSSEIDYIFSNVDVDLVILESKDSERMGKLNKKSLLIDLEIHNIEKPDDNPLNDSNIDPISYVMYTSGSTGKPKGVLIKESSIVNMLTDNGFNKTDKDRKVLQLAPYNFDGSIFDMFSTFLSGAHLYAMEEDILTNPTKLIDFIKKHKINQMLIMTPLLNHLADLEPKIFSQFKTIYFGGQEASVVHLKKIEKHCKTEKSLVHVYGATEGTIFNTYHILEEDDTKKLNIPIGKPIEGTGILILDQFGHIVYPNVEGEIYIAGEGVALGYNNDFKQTSEKFISLPYHEGKVYKTGDFGCRNREGKLFFLGRKDGQFQIRGYRIEIGEIINTILQNKEVDEFHLLSRHVKATGNKELIAYYTGKINTIDLRAYALSRLPDYKVPSFFIKVDQIPLKDNGKIDSDNLPSPLPNISKYEMPKTNTEKKVAEIWELIFEMEPIGRKDDFFELGGQSIKAMQIMQKISENFEIDIQIIEIFNFPLLADISAFIDQNKKRIFPPVLKAEELGKYPLSIHQKPLWLAHKLGQKRAYNSVFNFKLIGDLDVETLTDALNYTILNNEILRTVIIEESGEPFQVIKEDITANIEVVNICANGSVSEYLSEVIKEEYTREFKMEEGPLFRFKLLFDGKVHIGVFSVHHIIFDARSIEILIEEVFTKYKLIKEGISIYQDKEKLQFKDFSVWYNKLHDNVLLDKQKKYWFNLIEAHDVVETFSAKDTEGKGYIITFDHNQTKILEKIAKSLNSTIFSCLYTLYQIYVYKFAHVDNLIIATPGSIRINEELEQMIGYFVNLIPLSSELKEEMSLKDILVKSNESVKKSLDNRLISVNTVINQLREQYGNDFYPFDTTMTYVDQRNIETVEVDILNEKLKICPTDHKIEHTIARFNMEFIAVSLKDKIQIQIIYKPQVYEYNDIIGMEQAFFEIVKLLDNNIDILLGEIEIGDKENISDLTKNIRCKLNVEFD